VKGRVMDWSWTSSWCRAACLISARLGCGAPCEDSWLCGASHCAACMAHGRL